MGIIPIALATGSNPGRFPAAGSGRLINCFMEPAGSEAKTPSPVWGCAGLNPYKTVTGDGGVRLLFEVDGVLLAVIGRDVFLIRPGGAYTRIGGLATTGPVYAARNRRAPNAQVAIVSDGLYYLYEGGVLTAISDEALPSPSSVDFLDGYFLFTEQRGRITRSEQDSGAVFDGLAFANAESNPDRLVRGITHERMYVAFGARSTEFYASDASVDPFAFSRSTAIEVGCAAAGSVARVQQTILWIADDLTVRRLNGYAGQRISTPSVDRFIASIADLSQVSAITYTIQGNTFYTLNAPEGTWEYNLTTGLWHERSSYGLDRWRVSCVVEFDGKLIAGDYNSPTLYEMSVDAYAEGSDELVMTVQTPPVHAFPYFAMMSAAYIDVVPGVGLLETTETTTVTVSGGSTGTPIGLLLSLTRTGSTQEVITVTNEYVSNPALMLDWSDDGGITFGPTRQLPLGKMGQTQKRLKTLRLGRTKQVGRVFRMRVSAAVARGVLSMSADVAKLRP
jgi:hypothetical protein